MTDYKRLYGYDPFRSPAPHAIALSAMFGMFLMVAPAVLLFSEGNPWGIVPAVAAAALFLATLCAHTLAERLRCFRYRIPRKYAKVARSAYASGWRDLLIESPRAAVFAKAMTDMDYADHGANSEKTGHGPRSLANGQTYWGFFHDRQEEREDNPVYTAWSAARVLDERQESWASMPRLLTLAATVGGYVAARKAEAAVTVTELALAWFDSEMTDEEALRVLATYPAPIARLVLAGVPAEYASAVA